MHIQLVSNTVIPLLYLVAGLFWGVTPKNEPEWISPTYRELKYPRDQYYIGFASRTFDKDEIPTKVEQEVLTLARLRLVESVYVSISANSYNALTNSDGESSEYYSKKIVSRSSLETAGLATVVYLDTRKNIAYAFSSIRKSELRENYTRAFAANHERVESNMKQLADMSLQRLMLFSDEITQLQGQNKVLSFLGVSDPTMGSPLNSYLSQVEEIIIARSNSLQGLDQALSTLGSVLFSTLKPEVNTLKVNLLTYKDVELSSEFSLVLDQKLSQLLLENVEINDQSHYVLSGTFWPGKESTRLMISVNEYQAGENLRLLGTASVNIDQASINELDIALEPVLPEEPLMSSAEENPDYGGLIAEVTTQKGKEALAFWEGEDLKLAVKVSRPSYVQLVNIWADGSKYLLLDNYYLGIEEVNKEFWLPFSWETACPCGMENLYLRASNRPFPPVQVSDVDGFLKLETDIEVLLKLTRGFKSKNNEDYFAETNLSLMTFPKE